MTGILGEATIRELETNVAGSVIAPGDPNYETARWAWNHAIDRHPALIVRPASTEDVVRAVGFARSEGRPIAVRGGAHSVAGFSTCDDGIVIDIGQLNDVQVDPESRRAYAGGGTRWRELDAATQKYGLATTGGLVSTTGIGGFTLGGGLGHLVRKYGLACDNLLSVELVTADGSVIQASDSQNPELFWALRGGGGNFGLVTKFEFALHPVGPIVLGGPIFYPGQEAVQVMHGWRGQLQGMPDELCTFLSLATAPPAPFIPQDWHNRKVAVVVACWAGDPADGEDVVQALRTLGTPITDLLSPIPYVDLQQLFDAVWEAGRGITTRQRSLSGYQMRRSKPSLTITKPQPICQCWPSCTYITSAEQLREFGLAARHSPIATQQSSSTAPLVQPTRASFRSTPAGQEQPGVKWLATEKALCTSTSLVKAETIIAVPVIRRRSTADSKRSRINTTRSMYFDST